MPTCDCITFADLELSREAINRRSRASKALRARLALIAEHPEGEHRLLLCEQCGQFWQRSLAWNWGNKEYIFRVPTIDAVAWLARPFVQPDELLIFAAVIGQFLERQSFEATDRPCRREGCKEFSVKLSVFCQLHHIENLQSAHQLPQSPVGRWFAPYVEANFAIPARSSR